MGGSWVVFAAGDLEGPRCLCGCLNRSRPTKCLAGLLVAAAHALQLSELPTDPAVACAATPIKIQAFAVCRATGASKTCCQRLDSIYSNSSSPAAGCLCIPQVLYGTINATARFTINLLPLLQTCAASHGMQTDWALNPRTSCPQISITDSVISLLPRLGDARVGSPDRPAWAWSNLLQAQDIMAKPDLVLALAAGPVLGMQLLQNLLLMLLCTPGVFLAVHALLLCAAPAYRQLDVGQRLVTLQHAVFAVVFSLQLVPQTLMAVRLLFKAWTASYVSGSGLWDSFVGVLTMIAARGILYLIEAAMRVSVKTSWLLLVHHCLFNLILVLGLWTTNAATLVFGVVLDLFACHELMLSYVLVSYRLQLPSSFTARLLAVALVWFVLTRLAQTAMLFYMILSWASVPVVRTTPPFVVVSVLCGLFTVIQAWTLVIYAGIGRKLIKADAGKSTHAAERGDAGTPDATVASGYGAQAPVFDKKKKLLDMGHQGSSTARGGLWLMAGWGRSSTDSTGHGTTRDDSP